MRTHVNKILVVCVCLIFIGQLSVFNSVSAQVVPEYYRQQKQQEMARYKDSIHDEFLRYLEHLWTEYQLFTGEPSPRSIKPDRQPQIDTLEAEDTLKIDRQVPYERLTDVNTEGNSDFVPPVANATIRKRNYTFRFYGKDLTLGLPEKLADTRLDGNRERQVARYWKKLVENHADQCVASLDQQRRNLYLGDWGLFDLIRHFAAVVYPGHNDEQAILTVFILDMMHYDARLGRMGDRLVMLVNTGSRLYDIPYVEIDTIRYYAFGDLPRKSKIHTYNRQMAKADHPIDMNLAYSPRIGDVLSSNVFNQMFAGRKVSFCVNQSLVDFYARYPQTELSIYANAAVDGTIAVAIERELRPLVNGKEPVDALNTLLEYMQQGFVYQTDQKQFGRDKNFFCEENFYYPANDCEDRAVLFARLVKILLGYDVVLLEYSDHVATAVNVPVRNVKGHHIDIQGKRYMVCDPTCLGASVGDLSRKYRNKKVNVLKINA